MRILILGAGFAGVATARALEHRLRADEAEITIVGRDNFSLFTPMLPEVSAGGLETRHVVTPVRAELRRAQFVLGDVVAIDLDARTVEVQHNIDGAKQTLAYDHLVFALGSVTSTFGIPGVAEHALPLKTLEDAERLRNRAIASLELADVTSDPAERARLLTFVIVGGGYTGAEGTGEWIDLFHSITPYYRSIAPREVRIVLIEAGPALLAGLPPAMGRYTMKNLTARGVEVHLGDGVTSLDERGIHLASGTEIPTATVLWSAGVRPAPVVRDLPLRSRAQRRNLGEPRFFGARSARGVGARRLRLDSDEERGRILSDDGAARDSRRAGAREKHRRSLCAARPTKPFDFTALGTMASLGARRGVASLAGGLVITGFPAWFLWRTYYLLRLPGLDRKVRVALDWTLGLLFRRDIAELRVYTQRARERAARDAGFEG